MANRVVIPVVVSSDGRRHEPMLDGSVLPVSALPLSADKGNLLEVQPDGFFISGSSIISQTAGNPITRGADGGLLLDVAALIASGDRVLRKDGDAIGSQLDLRYDQATARLTLLGVGGAVVATVQLPVAAGIFTAAEVLSDYTPPSGGVEGTYIHLQFEATDGNLRDLYINVSDLVDTYTAGNGIEIGGNVVSVRVDTAGILGFTSDGRLRIAVSALVSSDPGNGLKLGSDGSLYSGVTQDMLGPGLKLDDDGRIVPDLADGLVVGADGRITINTEFLSEALAVGVSADAGNILMEGSDGRAFLPNDLGSL